ncbi:MAG TPA: 4-hydroxy-3-methylbut-2-enyl diphosphate reductase [Tepidisphaeraceae bacterium]|nr:4-hydroxy-3-methylbut-2-enyl diphosphate reductase [Tepidisphaeraceae bacterium]
MRILLANPRGFCAGVNMAIDCVDRVLELTGPPVYVFHEIVHNKHVVESFLARGVVFVNSIDQVPVGSVLVYSAHGVSPEIHRQAIERRLIEVDATCPLVTKVHQEVLRFAREGYSIVFIGHRDHDEAVGTVGEAPNSIYVVEKPQDVANLNIPDENHVAYVTQTTLSLADADSIISVLKQRFPNIVGPRKGDICYATTNRQNAVALLAPDVEVVLVVGSKNSSNSRRLLERARAAGKIAYLIDDESELDSSWLVGKQSVLVTAGASAPEHLVSQLLARLQREFAGVVEQHMLVQENVIFEPPRSLKSLAVLKQQ